MSRSRRARRRLRAARAGRRCLRNPRAPRDLRKRRLRVAARGELGDRFTHQTLAPLGIEAEEGGRLHATDRSFDRCCTPGLSVRRGIPRPGTSAGCGSVPAHWTASRLTLPDTSRRPASPGSSVGSRWRIVILSAKTQRSWQPPGPHPPRPTTAGFVAQEWNHTPSARMARLGRRAAEHRRTRAAREALVLRAERCAVAVGGARRRARLRTLRTSGIGERREADARQPRAAVRVALAPGAARFRRRRAAARRRQNQQQHACNDGGACAVEHG